MTTETNKATTAPLKADSAGFQWYTGREALTVCSTAPLSPESNGSDPSLASDLDNVAGMSRRERRAISNCAPELTMDGLQSFNRFLRVLLLEDVDAMNDFSFAGLAVDHLNIAGGASDLFPELQQLRARLSKIAG